jgi:hypothetical protein
MYKPKSRGKHKDKQNNKTKPEYVQSGNPVQKKSCSGSEGNWSSFAPRSFHPLRLVASLVQKILVSPKNVEQRGEKKVVFKSKF